MFTIETKEFNIECMKLDHVCESIIDRSFINLIYMTEGADNRGINSNIKTIKDAIKEFIQKLIEKIGDVSSEFIFKLRTKMNDIKFKYHINKMKKLLPRVKEIRRKKGIKTKYVVVCDYSKLSKEFIKAAKACKENIRLIFKCKTKPQIEQMVQKINKKIDELAEFAKTKADACKEKKSDVDAVNEVNPDDAERVIDDIQTTITVEVKSVEGDLEKAVDLLEKEMSSESSGNKTPEKRGRIEVMKETISSAKSCISRYASATLKVISTITQIISTVMVILAGLKLVDQVYNKPNSSMDNSAIDNSAIDEEFSEDEDWLRLY